MHSLELQALMIRTGKIYLKENPEILRLPTELFLDIEGIPERQNFYLIGLLQESMAHTCFPERIRSLPNANLHSGHVHFIVQAGPDLLGGGRFEK